MKEQLNNLTSHEALTKIAEICKHTRTCIMQTSLASRPIESRPMTIQKTDAESRIYFLSHKESNKNMQIKESTEMQITITNDKDVEYLSLFGKAEIYRDQAQIDEMYNAFANTWFKGKEDPNITIIRFSPEAGHYWDTKHGKVVQLIGMVIGAISKKQTDDGIQGEIRV